MLSTLSPFRDEVICAASPAVGSCESGRRCWNVQQSQSRVQSVHKNVRTHKFQYFWDWMFFLCRAHETYKAAVVKGDDGRPDFMARKSCNYLDDAIEVKHYDDDVDDDDDDIYIYWWYIYVMMLMMSVNLGGCNWADALMEVFQNICNCDWWW